jgi:hypothetical protein
VLKYNQERPSGSYTTVLLPQSTKSSSSKSSIHCSGAKKSCSERISDYRPINLAHNFSKIISKILENRLGPELENLISSSQTSFIKKCCIHDSFMFVLEAIRDLHKKKIYALFIKLDISKAFDTVNWPYLLEIMAHLGFGQK